MEARFRSAGNSRYTSEERGMESRGNEGFTTLISPDLGERRSALLT